MTAVLDGKTGAAGLFSPREMKVYRVTFALSACYNVVWGVVVILFPLLPFELARIAPPDALGILLWQCIGMFVLVYAVGYAYLAVDPLRYAPFALVALLGKVLGPIGWVYGWWLGHLPGASGLTIITNDLIWWPVYGFFVWKTIFKPRGVTSAPVVA